MHENPDRQEIRDLLDRSRTVAVVGLSDRPHRTSHAIADAFHHDLNPGGLTLREALDLSLPTWEPRGVRPKLHLSSQDPDKRPGAHACYVDCKDWQALLAALGGRDADVMVEAKGKEYALAPLGVEIR